MEFQTLNPATEELIKTYELIDNEELERKIDKAHDAFLSWHKFTYEQREKMMNQLADVLEADKKMHAQSITKEMGKPIAQSVGEIEKCAFVCRYYAQNAKSFLQEQFKNLKNKDSYITFEPLGVIYGIMPWNFPYWQFFRYAAPAIMAGNTTLLKHAPNVPECALNIDKLFSKAGFPESVFQSLFIDYEQSNQVIAHPAVKGVTLTGSDGAGSAVASEAGKHIKKTVLELGGSDPFIVLNDANLEEAAKEAATARMQNSGQSCIAAKRFIIEKGVADSFTNKFLTQIRNLKVGNPEDKNNYLGPLARKDLLSNLERQVNESVNAGAKVLIGGSKPEGQGYYYNPTVITNVKPNMPAYHEELFGPVAALFVVENQEEAIELANDTQYGLGAAIWSGDIEKAKLVGRAIETGTIAINGMVKSDPHIPFGGVKKSGYGRELSEFGIKEFLNVKTVNVF